MTFLEKWWWISCSINWQFIWTPLSALCLKQNWLQSRWAFSPGLILIMVDVGCDSHSRLLSYGKQCLCRIARVVSSCVVITYSAEYKLQIVSNLSPLASEVNVHRVKVFSSESPRSRHLTSLTMTHDKFNLSGRIGPPECSLIAWFMEPTWGASGADRTQVGPMLAPWTTLSEKLSIWQHWWGVVVLYMSLKGCGYTAGLANGSITVLFSHIHSREVNFTRCLSQSFCSIFSRYPWAISV